MEPVEKELSPADEWLKSLTAACNRLSTQYLNLLKSASSIAALQNYEEGATTDRGAASRHDPRGTFLEVIPFPQYSRIESFIYIACLLC